MNDLVCVNLQVVKAVPKTTLTLTNIYVTVASSQKTQIHPTDTAVLVIKGKVSSTVKDVQISRTIRVLINGKTVTNVVMAGSAKSIAPLTSKTQSSVTYQSELVVTSSLPALAEGTHDICAVIIG